MCMGTLHHLCASIITVFSQDECGQYRHNGRAAHTQKSRETAAGCQGQRHTCSHRTTDIAAAPPKPAPYRLRVEAGRVCVNPECPSASQQQKTSASQMGSRTQQFATTAVRTTPTFTRAFLAAAYSLQASHRNVGNADRSLSFARTLAVALSSDVYPKHHAFATAFTNDRYLHVIDRSRRS